MILWQFELTTVNAALLSVSYAIHVLFIGQNMPQRKSENDKRRRKKMKKIQFMY